MLLSERIRIIRESKKLTQEDVAFELGISASAYGQFERAAHKSSFEKLVKVANTLQVPISYLIDVQIPIPIF